MNNKDRVVGLLAMAAAFTSVSPAGDVAVNRVLKSGPGYKKKRKSKRRKQKRLNRLKIKL